MLRFAFGVAVGGGLAVTCPEIQARFVQMVAWVQSTEIGQWLMALV